MLELYLEATQERDDMCVDDVIFDEIKMEKLGFAYPNFTEYELKYFDILLRKLELSPKQTEYELNTIHAIQEAKRNADHVPPIILKDVSLHLKKWSIYWIVGKNGAGKTTLMHLLMSYFRSYTGEIYRGAHEQKTLRLEHTEQSIAVIEQEPFLLRWFTIRQNLLLWVKKEYTDDELYTLLSHFDMDNQIRELRKWLDTVYSYDCNFSWWQNQILSLLRVYLQDKPVMILDEWTNQLDAENEAKIMDLLLEKKQDKIILIISHRMTSMQKTDYLYCLEDWSITSQGTPQELKNTDSLYAILWKQQIE